MCGTRLFASILLCLSLAGCSVELDDDLLWVPENLTIDERFEGSTGLFMGRALSEPLERELSHREYWTTKIEYRLEADDFIPAEITRRTLPFEGGDLLVVEITREASATAQGPIFVHCYGIGANLYNNGIQHAIKLRAFGDSVQFDLPGHGESTGQATVANFEAAADALVAYINETVPEDRRLILWGHSLGGFVCSELARRINAADGLVLEAVGQNAATVARTWVPLPLRPFIYFKPTDGLEAYDLTTILNGVDLPVLMLAGGKDGIVPKRLVKDVADALDANGTNVTYHAFPRADHSTIAFADGFEDVVHRYLASVSLARD